MAKKEAPIVIKKVTVVSGGHHGGSWKVALADFMTSLMAFFLVMWLVGQSEETKKAVAEYFSSPSVIEYNFSNYGAKLTLEKLFLDFINDPLKTLKDFIAPVENSPDLLEFNSDSVVVTYLTEQLKGIAEDVKISDDFIEFYILDTELFIENSPNPSGNYINVMNKIKGIMSGLKETDVNIYTLISLEKLKNRNEADAKLIVTQRLDLIKEGVKHSLENDTVSVYGKSYVENNLSLNNKNVSGLIKFQIKKKSHVDDKKTSSFSENKELKGDNLVNTTNDTNELSEEMSLYKDIVDDVSSD